MRPCVSSGFRVVVVVVVARREAALGAASAGLLATMAFARVLVQYPDALREAMAIAMAVFVVVNLSIAIGA